MLKGSLRKHGSDITAKLVVAVGGPLLLIALGLYGAWLLDASRTLFWISSATTAIGFVVLGIYLFMPPTPSAIQKELIFKCHQNPFDHLAIWRATTERPRYVDGFPFAEDPKRRAQYISALLRLAKETPWMEYEKSDQGSGTDLYKLTPDGIDYALKHDKMEVVRAKPATMGLSTSGPAGKIIEPKLSPATTAQLQTVWGGMNERQRDIMRAFAAEGVDTVNIVQTFDAGWIIVIGNTQFDGKKDRREGIARRIAVIEMATMGFLAKTIGQRGAERYELTPKGFEFTDVIRKMEPLEPGPPESHDEITETALIEKALADPAHSVRLSVPRPGKPIQVLQVNGERLEDANDPLVAQRWLAVFEGLKGRAFEPQGQGVWKLTPSVVIRATQHASSRSK